MEVALYAGLPGLIYSVKTASFNPVSHFEKKVASEKAQECKESILRQFCTGAIDPSMTLPIFAQYTFQNTKGKVVRPLCYSGSFLAKSGEEGLVSLIRASETTSALPLEDLIMVCSGNTLRGSLLGWLQSLRSF